MEEFLLPAVKGRYASRFAGPPSAPLTASHPWTPRLFRARFPGFFYDSKEGTMTSDDDFDDCELDVVADGLSSLLELLNEAVRAAAPAEPRWCGGEVLLRVNHHALT